MRTRTWDHFDRCFYDFMDDELSNVSSRWCARCFRPHLVPCRFTFNRKYKNICLRCAEEVLDNEMNHIREYTDEEDRCDA